MFQLHYGNRPENLAKPLADSIELHQRGDPLAPMPIVVPNRAVEQFVKYAIAERLGVAANLQFPFLRRHLAEIVERADPEIRVLEVPRLQAALFEHLRGDACRQDEAFKPVRDYVSAGRAQPALEELRTFELAGRIAHLFQEYSISRQAMLRAWASDGYDDTRASPEERWQRRLWNAVFDRTGAARTIRAAGRRWMLLPRAFAALSDDKLRAALPPALHIFGLASPGRVFLEIFARLGALTNVFIYALNPCREFWEDLDTSAAARRSGWMRRGARIGAIFEESEDPFGLEAANDTRALQLWGRPGREYIRMLNELTECDFAAHFTSPDAGTLLAHLQGDILDRAVEGSRAAASPDDSIRFIGAPGIRREVEAVANEILRIVRESDRGPRALRFHEIAILIPDAATSAYLPHVETILATQFGIPVEIVGADSRAAPAAEAIDLLMRFPMGPATRTEVLRLMGHPAVAGSQLDAERIGAWCEELGVFFGADSSDLEDTYLPPNLFQWDQALTRAALGAFMESNPDENVLYESGAERLLPLNLPEEDLAAAARFLRIARMLLADAREMRSRRMPLGEWAVAMSEYIGRYVQAIDAGDQLIRDRFLASLESLESIESQPVGYEVAHAFLSGAAAEFGAYQGGFTGRGVAAGSLATLRALPFRAIFVMGLNEAAFPERERRDPLDLRLIRRHPGDISPSERDRYLFLEAILAARERIAFSWIERDPESGERLHPSTTLQELKSVLGQYLAEPELERLEVSHRISRYEPVYFEEIERASGSSSCPPGVIRPASFDPEARRGARMFALRESLAAAATSAPLPRREELLDRIDPTLRAKLSATLGLFELPPHRGRGEDEIDLPVAAIRRFLECPLQGSARYALQMADEDEPRPDIDDEPVAQTRLAHSSLLNESFWAARGDPEKFRIACEEKLEIAQMRGEAPAGPFLDAALRADCARFERWRAELGDLSADLGRWQTLRMGRGGEFSTADRVLPSLEIAVRAPDAAGNDSVRKVRLYGALGTFPPTMDRAIRLIARAEPKPRDFLDPIIAAIVLAAAGEAIGSTFEVIVLGGAPDAARRKKASSWRRVFRPPPPETARAWLAGLISELIRGAHDYFLPIEAAAAAWDARKKGGSVEDAVDGVREGFGGCASDYGPVRHGREYEPPEEAEIVAILQRRFAPIAVIFEGKEGK